MTRSSTFTILEKVLPTLSVVLFIAAWELLVHWRGITPIFLPAPTSIAFYLWQMLADGSMEYHLAVTLLRIFAGFVVATVTGIALGLLMGHPTPSPRIIRRPEHLVTGAARSAALRVNRARVREAA